jgi:ElaA protein
MELKTKYFNELSTIELYEILKARSQIFVIEQKCIYQDLDDIDYKSIHIFYQQDNKVIAYLRIFPKEENWDIVQMGRVLSIEHGKGLGGKVLKEGIKFIKEKINAKKIYIEAQCYVIGFYKREGFKICSEEFLEDGIPHIKMELELK